MHLNTAVNLGSSQLVQQWFNTFLYHPVFVDISIDGRTKRYYPSKQTLTMF